MGVMHFPADRFPRKRHEGLSYGPLTALAPIANMVDVPAFIYLNATVPAHNFAEFKSYAEKHAGILNYGTPGDAVPCDAGLGMSRARRFETITETLRRLHTEGVGATIERIVRSWFADPVRNAKAHRLCVEAGRGMCVTAAVAAIHATHR